MGRHPPKRSIAETSTTSATTATQESVTKKPFIQSTTEKSPAADSSSSQPVDLRKRIQNCVNEEQKYVWEQVSKNELSKAVGSALSDSMIPDLQKIAVNHAEPSFSNTFIWQLKPIDQCSSNDWKNHSVAKNLLDETSGVSNVNENADHNENEEVEGDHDENDEGDSSSKKAKSKKGKKPPVLDKSFLPYVSKSLGLPYLKPGEVWPVCTCGKSLSFLFQLLLSDMPEHLGVAYQLPGIPVDKQLLQLFLCGAGCDTGRPFNSSSCVRIVDISGYDPVKYKFPLKNKSHIPVDTELIHGWIKQRDYPHHHDYDKYGLTPSTTGDDDDDEAADDLMNELVDEFPCVRGEKLSGHPYFIQGAEYPACTTCSKQMRFVFQVRGENFCVEMGDGGVGHIYQCRDHPEILTLGWAC